MVEPRKPRVIRTRPGTVPPPAADNGPSGTDPFEQAPSITAPSNTAAADVGTASVHSTSAKVSVEPVPLEDTSTGDQPVKAKAKAKSTATAKAKAASAAGGAADDDAGAAQGRKWRLPKLPAIRRRPNSAVHADASGQGAPRDGSARDGSVRNTDGSKQGSEQGPEKGANVLAFPVSSFKRRRRNLLLGVSAVVAVLALVMGVALFSPALAVKQVVFDGQKLVGEDILQAAVSPILSKPLPQVTESEVQELLAPVIQVKSARIEAKPPSTLVVHIVERVPVALLKNDSEYLLVDQDGVELGSTKDPAKVALPLIDGGKAAIGNDTFRAITAVLANLPQPILAQLANASAKSPDAVELKLADGRMVIWGNPSDMELKAEVLGALLNAPPPTPEPGKPAPVPAKVFDVSAPRHPVTR